MVYHERASATRRFSDELNPVRDSGSSANEDEHQCSSECARKLGHGDDSEWEHGHKLASRKPPSLHGECNEGGHEKSADENGEKNGPVEAATGRLPCHRKRRNEPRWVPGCDAKSSVNEQTDEPP